MTVNLQLKPDVEAGLIAQAQARGLSLETYLEQVLQERSRSLALPSSDPAGCARSFETWAHNHPLTPSAHSAVVGRCRAA